VGVIYGRGRHAWHPASRLARRHDRAKPIRKTNKGEGSHGVTTQNRRGETYPPDAPSGVVAAWWREAGFFGGRFSNCVSWCRTSLRNCTVWSWGSHPSPVR